METRDKSLTSSVISVYFLNLKEGSESTNRAVLPSKHDYEYITNKLFEYGRCGIVARTLICMDVQMAGRISMAIIVSHILYRRC
jgi:hypothetical protein